MASLDDVLTISKNIVTAINNASQTYLNVNGVRSSVAVTTETLIVQGSARVVRVIVTVAGSTSGTLIRCLLNSGSDNDKHQCYNPHRSRGVRVQYPCNQWDRCKAGHGNDAHRCLFVRVTCR